MSHWELDEEFDALWTRLLDGHVHNSRGVLCGRFSEGEAGKGVSVTNVADVDHDEAGRFGIEKGDLGLERRDLEVSVGSGGTTELIEAGRLFAGSRCHENIAGVVEYDGFRSTNNIGDA